LRNLEKENPTYARPQNVALIGAFLSFTIGGMCMVIANEATPHTAFLDNPLTLFCIFVSVASFAFALIPKIFNWGWKARYFGISMIYLTSVSLLGLIPWLCIVLYSAQHLWMRLIILVGYAVPIILWCRRFAKFYAKIFANQVWHDFIYREDTDAVYYMQKNDNWLVEKRYKLAIFPSGIATVAPVALAFVLVPFIKIVNSQTGLPFAHTFLSVAGLPIIMTFLGLGMRGFLVFYYYPWKIKQATGKDVYVDMVTKTTPPKIR
jgi:hypothetical protein